MKVPAFRRPSFQRPTMTPQLSRRLRAILACGILLGTGTFGTAALWSTAPATTSGQFTTASLEIKANGSATYTFTFPGNLLPGDTTAFVINVQNTGSTAFTYVGTVTSGNALGQAFKLTARAGGSVSGTTCTGGTAVATDQQVTNAQVPFRPTSGNIAAATGVEALCLQLSLPLNGTGDLSNSTGSVLFTFNATGV